MKKFRIKLFLILFMLSILSGYSVFSGLLSDTMENYFLGDSTFFGVEENSQVTDIYKFALKNIKKSEFAPISQSMEDTANVLNTKYGCNLNQDDVFHIMRYMKNFVGTNLENLIYEQTALAGQNGNQISSDDFIKSCTKLISCKDKIQNPKNIKIGLSLASVCNDEVVGIFSIANHINHQEAVFTQDSYGTEIFKNGSSDDSDFDIMVDIHNLGKILFEGFKPPVEIVYYKMVDQVYPPSVLDGAEVDNQGVIFGGMSYDDQEANFTSQNTTVGSNNNIPTNKPKCPEGYFFSNDKLECCQLTNEDLQEFSCIQAQCLDGFVFVDGECKSTMQIEQENAVRVDNSINKQTQQFIQSSSTSPATNYSSIVPGNLCVTQSSYTPEQENLLNENIIDQEPQTPEYPSQEFCQEGYQKLGNLCCPSSTEGKTQCIAPSCSDGGIYDYQLSKCISPHDSNGDGTLSTTENNNMNLSYQNFLGESIDDLKAEKSFGDCNQECNGVKMDAQSFLQKMGTPYKELACETNCCAVKCKNLPITDRFLCVSQCLCTTVSSPVFDANKHPGLDSIYKIQMCMVAPANTSFSRGKTVYSIQEVVNEVVNILTDLKDSGKTIATVKTKELLDSSMKRLKFSDVFSFNLILKTRDLFGNVSDYSKEQKAIEQNKNLKNMFNPENKNKYVVLFDVAEEKAKLQNIKTEDLEAETEKLKNSLDSIFSSNGETIMLQKAEILKRSANIKSFAQANDEISDFVSLNLSFWQDLSETMESIKKITETMSKKEYLKKNE